MIPLDYCIEMFGETRAQLIMSKFSSFEIPPWVFETKYVQEGFELIKMVTDVDDNSFTRMFEAFFEDLFQIGKCEQIQQALADEVSLKRAIEELKSRRCSDEDIERMRAAGRN